MPQWEGCAPPCPRASEGGSELERGRSGDWGMKRSFQAEKAHSRTEGRVRGTAALPPKVVRGQRDVVPGDQVWRQQDCIREILPRGLLPTVRDLGWKRVACPRSLRELVRSAYLSHTYL